MNRPILRQVVRDESSLLFRRAVSPLLLVLSILVSACDNEPGRSFAPDLTVTANQQNSGRLTNFRNVTARVSLNVRLLDQPMLGRPIRVEVDVRALAPAPSVNLTLTLPELEVARVSAWHLRRPPPAFE